MFLYGILGNMGRFNGFYASGNMLKEFLGGKRFESDAELENAVTTWLNEMAAEEYNKGILKPMNRYDKCLNVGGADVEK
ncbi:hypothetical protein AVEN_33094-1 [Araneus ventricosus]|uniref:Uncharacterized protein n=1 Tax=Araneus ventricosus TaxID=182803 RepID=A0A4Y2CVE9_ARAVE|nr:hypothetical protein AVEN_33094-1 [Araneus ventricosus]